MTLQSIEKLRESLKACTSEAGVEPNRFDTYWITASACDMLIDGIEAEIAERFMELPVDADGVPIRVGDELYNGEVIAFGGLAEGGVVFVHRGFEDGNYILEAFASNVTHHVKQRTVEDVLCDMIHEYACTDMTTEQTAAKYAAELRDLLEVRDD